MIRPNVDDVLAVVIETIERDIAPEVDDEYAASLCRTVSQLLRSARVRVVDEGRVLTEDNEELRALLVALREAVPAEVGVAIDQTLAACEASAAWRSVAEVEADALRLRGLLVEVIETVDTDGPEHGALQTYLQHQLERQRPWLVDAFTGPRR